MKTCNRRKLIFLAASFFALTTTMWGSLMLTPGTTGAPPLDLTSNLGSLVASTTVNLTPLSQTFSGTEHEEVYLPSTGGYIFAYQFNTGPGVGVSDPIVRATMNPFTGFTTGVAYRTSAFGGFSASTNSPASADRNAVGDTVGFDTFGAGGVGVPNGSSSSVLLIFTNAPNYTARAFMSVSDGGTATNFAYGPSSAVPEPTTSALLGGGLLVMGFLTKKNWRRKNTI